VVGKTSPASCLTYLTNQVLYLGSHSGSSQLLRIESTPVSLQENPALQIPSDIKITTENEFLLSSKGKAKVDVESNTQGTIISAPGTRLTVLEAYQNIAPITDAVLLDPDGSGQVIKNVLFVPITKSCFQPNVVTCSGAGNTGSLNIVQKGADFEELAAIDNPLTVTGIWALRPQIGNK
jgi:DNA damage-binding protein 1